MNRTFRLIWGVLLGMNFVAQAQSVPRVNAPNTTVENTKIFFLVKHEIGNEYYEYEVDTSLNFNSGLLRTVVGTTDHSATPDWTVITDSVENLHYGKTYYWRSRSKVGSSYSAWSSPLYFTTFNIPQINAPINESTVNPNNFDIWTTHKRGNKEYIMEASLEVGFNYPIYYRDPSAVFNLNPNMDHNTDFSTNLLGLPSSGAIYIRMMVKNDVDSSGWSEIVKVYLDETLNTKETTLEASKLYPNPSNGIFNFVNFSGIEKISVVDVKGKIVYTETLNGSSSTIDLRYLPNGFYVIRMVKAGIVSHRKVQIVK